MKLETSILIHASRERVWNTLTDFSGYPEWNPFVRSLNGNVVTGEHIVVHIQPPGQKGMTFKPVVLAFEPQQKLEWLGRLFLPGIFDGAHCFELIDNGNGTTTLVQSERFKGILVPFLKKMLHGPTLE
jgi:hypothetical protein